MNENSVKVKAWFPVSNGHVEIETEFPKELMLAAAKDGNAATFIIQELLRIAMLHAPCADQMQIEEAVK